MTVTPFFICNKYETQNNHKFNDSDKNSKNFI